MTAEDSAANVTLVIRAFAEGDWPALWSMLEPVFRAGETYAVDPDLSEAEARALWVERARDVQVAIDEGEIVGTYYLKANHAGPGAHVCNAGYVVVAAARGRGIATAMCEHSQLRARALGFSAMQYNLVAESNRGAVRLWKRMGFEVVGTLPRAFHHPREGRVAAYVMYKWLEPDE